MDTTGSIKIRILHKLPTPYNDQLFRVISHDPNVSLHVHHLWRGSWRRPWTTALGTGYSNRYMNPFLGVDWRFLWLGLRERTTFFMIGDWGHAAALVLILARIISGGPVAVWTDTPQEHLPRPRIRGWLRTRLLRFLLARVNIVFASGRPGLREIQKMGARLDRLVNLPFVVDLDRPNTARDDPGVRTAALALRRQVACDDGDTVFTTSATLVERKGIDTAIKAFAKCVSENQDCGLLIAGEGPDRRDLEVLVERLGLRKHVAFLGWLEPDQMEALYMATDVLVHPALWDPYPLVVLEAMSWSLPVVGSNTSGSVEDRIRPGVNGFSFRAGDTEDLHEKMRTILRHPEVVPTIGREARLTAEEWPLDRAAGIIIGTAAATMAKRTTI